VIAAGKTVYRYADEIFSLGRELEDVVRAISVEKRMQHPAVVAISKSARQSFQPS